MKSGNPRRSGFPDSGGRVDKCVIFVPVKNRRHDLSKQGSATNRLRRRRNGCQSLFGYLRRSRPERDDLPLCSRQHRTAVRTENRLADARSGTRLRIRPARGSADRRKYGSAESRLQSFPQPSPDRRGIPLVHLCGRSGRIGTRIVVDAGGSHCRCIRRVAQAAVGQLRYRQSGLPDRTGRTGDGRRKAGSVRRHVRRLQLHGIFQGR